MPNEDLIREIATRACREALREKSQELAADVAKCMVIALASQFPQRERTKEFRDGAVLIAGSNTQTEALETLVAASSAITPACGLMILRGAQAIGWHCHNLTSPENFKRTTMDCTGGIAATVIDSCTGMAAQGSELDPLFVGRLGLENAERILIVPVLLKERVAALLVAVSEQFDDLAGLELLVQVAQLTLDLQAYRKASPRPVVPQKHRAEPQRSPAAPPQSRPAMQSHGAAYGAVAASSTRAVAPQARPEPVYANSVTASVVGPPPAPPHVAAPALRESFTPTPSITPVLDEAHEKARRFAKLLVEEIKLYNQTKVAEGFARCDLYSRLRDDIEKSRAAYQNRYGERVKDVDYFAQELMRILADNNPAVMGAGFPG